MNDLNNLFKSIANGYDQKELKNEVMEKLFSEQEQKLERQTAYNFDYSSINFLNLSKEEVDALHTYMYNNELIDKLIKAVKMAAKKGMGGILQRFVDGKVLSQNVYIYSKPRTFNDVITEVYLTTDLIDLEAYDEESIELMRLWLNEEGKYVLTYVDVPLSENGDSVEYINGKVQMIEINGELVERQYVYDSYDSIPLEILKNNEDAKADIDYARETLRLFTKFDSILEVEWEYLKVQMINNLLTGSDKSAEELQAEIENGGKRIHDLADIDGLGGTPLSILSAGGITAEIARVIKNNYKEEYEETIFALGKLSGGNNKHTTEAILSNVDAFKYLFIKKEYFTHFLSRLFTKLLKSTNLVKGINSETVPFVKLEVKFSHVIEMILTPEGQGNVPTIQNKTTPKEPVEETK